ncbi:N-acetylmuramoyl-L-alanine amidase family protein [Paenibacillus tundrae]|uniref:N-acetylmuramoyl-L-alanine amidase family protein n=1 Tax=Paenibacillus tundrae TaxID=528187 RepID=UPI0030CBA3A2
MRKWSAVFVFILFLCVFPTMVHADTPPSIVLDGVTIEQQTGAPAENTGKTVMVPIRVVSENLGYEVKWEKTTQTVSVLKGARSIQMVAGQEEATVNGTKVSLDAPPLIKQGTTLVPLRFVGEGMGLNVGWDNGTKTVSLSSLPPVVEVDNGEDSIETPVSVNLSELNSINFSGNQLSLEINGNITPKLSTLTNPDRIIVDLPGTTFSQQFIQGQASKPDGSGSFLVTDSTFVNQIRYANFSNSPATVRVVFDLSHVATAKWSLGDNQKILIDLTPNSDETPITPPPAVQVPNGTKVVIIDPGHGGRQSGAVSVTGKYEKDFNLAVGLKVQALLQPYTDIQTVITRKDDTELSLQQRVDLAELNHADVFVSIHGNKFTTPVPNGVETLYTRSESKELADILHKYVLPITGLKDRGIKTASLHVTRETTMPAVLLELGFLSNESDEAIMFTEDYQNKCAQAIVDGILEFLNKD